jgi:adenylosuccinate synthase
VLTAKELPYQNVRYDFLTAIGEGKEHLLHDLSLSSLGISRKMVNALILEYDQFLTMIDIVPDGSLESLDGDTVIFEGSQGVLLDEVHGYAPHNTWSDCTFGNADKLLVGIKCETTRIGVTRTYMTRHGTGPFPTEDPSIMWPDHNKEGEWQGAFRQGVIDIELLRYAIEKIGKLDGLAVTHLDRIVSNEIRFASRFPYAEPTLEQMWTKLHRPEDIRTAWWGPSMKADFLGLKVPVMIESRGPTAADKRFAMSAICA